MVDIKQSDKRAGARGRLLLAPICSLSEDEMNPQPAFTHSKRRERRRREKKASFWVWFQEIGSWHSGLEAQQTVKRTLSRHHSCNYFPLEWSLNLLLTKQRWFLCVQSILFPPLMYPGAATSHTQYISMRTWPPLRGNKRPPYRIVKCCVWGGAKEWASTASTVRRTILVHKSLCEVGVSFPEAKIDLNGLETHGRIWRRNTDRKRVG